MEHIPEQGFPNIFVVARTDTADLEVYPYEVVKWILRMRGKKELKSAKSKLLSVSEGRGHFTTTFETRAEDLAFLDTWLNNLTSSYKMAPSRKNRASRKNRNNTMMRKNRASRKNRNNMTMRKNRNRKNRTNMMSMMPTMMGGFMAPLMKA
jgi:hypothetical protein